MVCSCTFGESLFEDVRQKVQAAGKQQEAWL